MNDIDDIANERSFSSIYIRLAFRNTPAFEIAYSADGDINVRTNAGHKVEKRRSSYLLALCAFPVDRPVRESREVDGVGSFFGF